MATVEAEVPESLATAEEFGTYSGEDVGGSADLLLGAASAVVRSFCGWRITRGTDTAVLEQRGPLVLLPTTYLRRVVSLEVGGVPVDLEGTRMSPAGLLWPPLGSWWTAGQAVATFEHGYDVPPADVKAVTLAVATRMLVNPASITQETLGGYSATYAQGGAVGLLKVERSILNRHRVMGRP